MKYTVILQANLLLKKERNRHSGGFFENNIKTIETYDKVKKKNKLNAVKNQSRKATSHIVIMRWWRYLKKGGNTFQKQNETYGLNL